MKMILACLFLGIFFSALLMLLSWFYALVLVRWPKLAMIFVFVLLAFGIGLRIYVEVAK